jgi:NAD(P)-dependent dehydrogenase (short-subunit alcohol dehydrogenase family)
MTADNNIISQNKKKVAIVTGSSSGIGLETVLTLAQNGFMTYATMRNPDKAPDILEDAKRKMNLPIEIVQLDTSDDNSTQQAISFIAKKEGQINLLVNNTGYTQLGAIEDLTLEEVAPQFNTNVFGVFRTIKQVVPIMRNQRSTTGSTIINIGSANGFFGVPCASAYVATKFALEGVTQSLRYELHPLGSK